MNLRQMDIPVHDLYTKSKEMISMYRVNTCAPLFESGMIWAPDHEIRRRGHWRNVQHSRTVIMTTLVDSMTMAVMRFRQGGFLSSTLKTIIDEPKQPPRIDGILLMYQLVLRFARKLNLKTW